MESQNKARALDIKMTLAESGHSRSGGGGSGGTSFQSNMLKLAVCLMLLNLLLANLAAGQFFTKSSKSIPRMGRRSLPDYKSELEAYQQLLAEEYEQNLINDALERQQQTTMAADELGRAEREPETDSDRNRKLSDLLKLGALSSRTPRASDEFDAAAALAVAEPKAMMTRNERARPQSFGDRLVAAAAAAAAQQQQQREETAARMEATRERAW